jgi:hypothetical protein
LGKKKKKKLQEKNQIKDKHPHCLSGQTEAKRNPNSRKHPTKLVLELNINRLPCNPLRARNPSIQAGTKTPPGPGRPSGIHHRHFWTNQLHTCLNSKPPTTSDAFSLSFFFFNIIPQQGEYIFSIKQVKHQKNLILFFI